MTKTIDAGFDEEEEKTLPPLPKPEAIYERRDYPSAGGDFRTYETTCAVRTGGSISAVRLTSALGYVAQFAVDSEIARRVARELDRQLGEPYYANQRLVSESPGPARATLIRSGTDVFFPIEETPRIRVEQEPGGIGSCFR